MYRLLEELGMKHFRQNTKGKKAYLHSNGKVTFYSGDVPPASLLGLIDVQLFIWKMAKIVEQFPKDKTIDVWDHPQAKQLDCLTVEAWGRQNMWTEAGVTLLNQAVR